MKNSLLEKLGAAARRDSFTAKSKLNIKGLLLLFAILLINTQLSWGQVNYVTWNFTTSITSASYATNTTNQNSARSTGLTGPTLSLISFNGTGIAGGTGNTLHRTTGWPTTQDNSKYIEFSVTLAAGQKFNDATMSLAIASGVSSITTAPRNYQVQYGWGPSPTFTAVSGSNAAAVSTSGGTVTTLNTVSTNNTAIIPAPGNATSTILKIRLIAYGSTSSTGNIQFHTIALTSASLPVTGSSSPTLTADATTNTVDNSIDITFSDDSAWRTAVTAVKIGATTLTSGTDYDLTAGNLQLKPSGLNVLLTTPGSKSVTVVANGYTDATVTQVINAGAPTTNSTATISAALAPNTSRTITCTAKDQYNNLVSGYSFAYDVTLTNNNSTTAESYTINSSPFTATSTSGNSLSTTTNASGVATFTAALPATIDPSDGISVQVQLNNDATNVGSAFTFAQLASQTITFGAITLVTYGDATFGLTATASSTLPVSYASSNTAVATVTGSTVTIVGAGSTNITVSQAGDGSYNAAEDVIQSLTVNAKELTLPDAVATSRAYNTLLTTNITGTLTGVINSDDVTFDGTLKGTFADANVANGIAVTSNCTLAGTKAGNYSLTQPTGLTANITQASQTITFGVLANKIIGAADYSPGATSATSVTNAITYASSNLDVATIVSNQIQIVGIGSTNITASQAGSLNYTAATDVVRSLTVIAAPIAAWDFTGIGSVTNTSLAATTLDNGLGATSITRGASAAWSIANNSWRTTGFQNNGISTGNTDYFQITIQANTGKTVSLTTIDANFAGTAGFTVSPGVSSQFAYSLDGTNFTLIGSPTLTIGTPATMTQIDLTSVTALQNVASGTTITLRYYASGQTTSGGWGFNSVSAATNGLAIGGVTTLVSSTWNGTSWSNGAPTATVDAIISGDYSAAANITAKTLTVNNNAVATIPSGNNVTVTGAVTVTAPATLTLSNNANLIQDPATTMNSNVGVVTVKRNSNALKRLDYTLWSSPVANQNLLAFSPLTSLAPNRFYIYNPASDKYTNTVPSTLNPNTTNFSPGVGYLIRMPNENPAILGTSSDYYLGNAAITYNGEFTGIPNNGDVSVALSADGLNGYNLVGNPYPSTINLFTLQSNNASVIRNTFYMWRKTNGTGTAYCYYIPTTASTGTYVSNNNTQSPIAFVGDIQVGQGFFVSALTTGPLVFKNGQRVTTASSFFKTKQLAASTKVWLNATNAAGYFSQMAVTYFDGATQGVDAFDGKYINDSAFALTSNVNNEEYTIQGRPAFDASDVVALNFKTDFAGDYTIAIDHVDGLFSGSQDIYLVDSKTGMETNLKTSSYTFAATAAVDNTRFSLKFQKTLSIDAQVLNDNSVLVYKNNGLIYVNSKVKMMNNIKVFDIQGRLLAERKNVKSNATSIQNLSASNQILIVKVTTDDNQVISKKVEN